MSLDCLLMLAEVRSGLGNFELSSLGAPPVKLAPLQQLQESSDAWHSDLVVVGLR